MNVISSSSGTPASGAPNAAVKSTGWRRMARMFMAAINAWLDHRASSKGAALAFYMLFSMAPILVLVIAIAGAFFGDQAARGQIVSQLSSLVGKTGAEAIQMMLVSANNSQSGVIATTIATALLLIGATSVFSELKDSLDEIWQMPKPKTSGVMGLVRARLLSFGLILVLGLLLLVSLVISAVLTVLENYWRGLSVNFLFVLTPLSSLISFLIISSLFAAIFKLLPQVALSWRDVWIGSLGTAALFTLGKYLIGVYLGNSGVANSYGAAGSLIILILWIYYSAMIVYFGAEFTKFYAVTFGDEIKPTDYAVTVRQVEEEKGKMSIQQKEKMSGKK